MDRLLLSLLMVANYAQAQSINFDWIPILGDYLFEASTEAPLQVLQSANSVLFLKSAGGHSLLEVDATANGARDLALTFRSSKATPAAEQIEYCIRAKIKRCQIFEKNVIGSGFRVSTNGAIVTSFHLLQAQLRANFLELNDNVNLEQVPQKLRKSVYLTARDFKRRGVFSTRSNVNAIQLQSFNYSPLFLMVSDTTIFTQSVQGEINDLVELSGMDSTHINTIPVANRDPIPNEILYLAGYSGPENRLEITAGSAITVNQFISRTGLPKSERERDLRDRFLIHVDADCQDGMSGGPILNKDGEAVAVIAGRHQDRTNGRGICYGIKLNSLDGPRGLRNEWKSFSKQSLKRLAK